MVVCPVAGSDRILYNSLSLHAAAHVMQSLYVRVLATIECDLLWIGTALSLINGIAVPVDLLRHTAQILNCNLASDDA